MLKCDPRAFARCPYHATCVSVDQAEFTENSDCHIFNKKVLEKPLTHGDEIRSMTDMELATFLYTITRACADHDCSSCPIGQQNCIVMLYWIKKPKTEK